jgi:hypothetical protein
METRADPEFLAETKKSNLDIDPLPGEEIEKIVAQRIRTNTQSHERRRPRSALTACNS